MPQLAPPPQAGPAAPRIPSQGWLLQDLLLIVFTVLLTLALLLDAFKRENAYQLLACLGLGALQISQLAVFLVSRQALRGSPARSDWGDVPGSAGSPELCWHGRVWHC